MLVYLFTDIICSAKRKVFPERILRKTVPALRKVIVFIIIQIFFTMRVVLKIGEHLTIILRNCTEYRLIPSRWHSARLSRIIVLLFNKLITKLVTFLNLSVDIFLLHFFFPCTKLHILPDICYLRMTDIESIMNIFGKCYNLLNNNLRYSPVSPLEYSVTWRV